VRQLCELLDPRNVFETLAGGLQHEDDLDFASQMVQTLNLILLTSQEAMELRMMLKKPAEGAALFQTIYPAWSHNPVSLLSLCLLTQAFEHAAELVVQFAQFEMTLPFLVQIDKLVQLFESPIFTHVRLQLLEPEQHPSLIKALCGILMLLPQAPAFHTLKHRLASVPEIGLLRLQLQQQGKGRISEASHGGGGKPEIDFKALLRTYQAVQEKHQKSKLHASRRVTQP